MFSVIGLLTLFALSLRNNNTFLGNFILNREFPMELFYFLRSLLPYYPAPYCLPSSLLLTQFIVSCADSDYKGSPLSLTGSRLSGNLHRIRCTKNGHEGLYPSFCILPPPSCSQSRVTRAHPPYLNHPSLLCGRASPSASTPDSFYHITSNTFATIFCIAWR